MRPNPSLIRIGLTATVLLAGDMALRLVYAAPPQNAPAVLTAQEFRVVDKQGHLRARIGVEDQDRTTVISLYDQAGKQTLITLAARPQNDYSALTITDSHGQNRVWLSGRGDLGPCLYLSDPHTQSGAILQTCPNGDVGLLLDGKQGQRRAAFGTSNDEPSLWMNNGSGKQYLAKPAESATGKE